MSRLREEDGFLLLELMMATVVLSIAVLALMAGYDSAFVSVHKASQKSVATALADQQLELYGALPYASIGLDPTATANAGSDSLYDGNALLDGTKVVNGVVEPSDGVVNDLTVTGCGTAPNCEPIQTVTGTDGHSYRLETFVRCQTASTSSHSWAEIFVNVIVRDPSTSGEPELVRLQTGFDSASGAPCSLPNDSS